MHERLFCRRHRFYRSHLLTTEDAAIRHCVRERHLNHPVVIILPMDPSRQDQVGGGNFYLRSSSSRLTGIPSPSASDSQNYLTPSNTPGHLLLDLDRPVTSRRTHPEDRISPASHYSAPDSPTSVPSRPPVLPSSNFFRFSEDVEKQPRFTSAPSLRVHPAPEHATYSPHSSRSTTADMSTVAVHYDSRFEMGVPRSTYSWPGKLKIAKRVAHSLLT